jgi:hypothetical protein
MNNWNKKILTSHTGRNYLTFSETQSLNDASKEVGLEVSTDKSKYMLLSRHQNAGQNHDINTANIPFENVAQFRYLGITITTILSYTILLWMDQFSGFLSFCLILSSLSLPFFHSFSCTLYIRANAVSTARFTFIQLWKECLYLFWCISEIIEHRIF